jgi:hypothetical protein
MLCRNFTRICYSNGQTCRQYACWHHQFTRDSLIRFGFVCYTNCRVCARYEALTALVMKTFIFWDVMQCSPVQVKRRFGGTCRLRLQNWRWSASLKHSLSAACFIGFFSLLTLQSWRRRWHGPPKRRLTFTGVHVIIYQKIKVSHHKYIHLNSSCPKGRGQVTLFICRNFSTRSGTYTCLAKLPGMRPGSSLKRNYALMMRLPNSMFGSVSISFSRRTLLHGLTWAVFGILEDNKMDFEKEIWYEDQGGCVDWIQLAHDKG